MAVAYNFRKGIDFPVWQWLPFSPFISYHGTSNVYDGNRYIYFIIMYGTTAASASTSALLRFDTWSLGWTFMTTIANSGYGMDIEYDKKRNVLFFIMGAALTSWQAYNLNLTAVTVGGVTLQPYTLTTMAPALPATAGYGASITIPNDIEITEPIETGSADTGSTATNILDAADAMFGTGMVGLQLRFTSGTLNGQKRTISAVASPDSLTVAPGFSAAPVAGDTFVIEMQDGTSTGTNTTTTLNDTAKSWAANQYRDMDVSITGGTGAGQRRKIASNTATALTVAVAFATTPDATSTYTIVPSSDLIWFQRGSAGVELYQMDLSAATLAWSANLGSLPAIPGGGANTFYPQNYAPYSILAVRGAATNTIYQFSIGLRTWATLPSRGTTETFTTGSSAAMLHGKRRIFQFKEGITTRTYAYDLTNGIFEPFPQLPYANPGAYDGKRARYVKTPDGAEYMYLLRAGGQEFFRVPLEWFD